MDKSTKEILNGFLKDLESGKKFVLEQTPDVIQQKIRFDVIQSILVLLMLSIIHIISIITIAIKYKTDEMAVGVSIVASFLGLLMMLQPANLLLQIFIAPKTYILEIVKQYLKR